MGSYIITILVESKQEKHDNEDEKTVTDLISKAIEISTDYEILAMFAKTKVEYISGKLMAPPLKKASYKHIESLVQSFNN